MRQADEKKPPRLSYRLAERGCDEDGTELAGGTKERHEQERDARRDEKRDD